MKAFEYVTDIEHSFSEIIKTCQPYCSYFTLTEQTTFLYDGLQYKKFIQSLEPYLVTSFLTIEWYCYFTSDANKLKISVYHLNRQTEEILSSTFQDIFMEPNLGFEHSHEFLPEDICFFRKDKSLFFGSVSHESIARFYVTETELESCQFPEVFEELPYETSSPYNGKKVSLWSNYNITF